MRKRKPAAPWLVLGPDPWFATCQRCGHHERHPTYPLSIPAFVAYVGYLELRHQFCREGAAVAAEPLEVSS